VQLVVLTLVVGHAQHKHADDIHNFDKSSFDTNNRAQ
jgi:hypothetical protein